MGRQAERAAQDNVQPTAGPERMVVLGVRFLGSQHAMAVGEFLPDRSKPSSLEAVGTRKPSALGVHRRGPVLDDCPRLASLVASGEATRISQARTLPQSSLLP